MLLLNLFITEPEVKSNGIQIQNFPATALRYLTLEPSLAIDSLEIDGADLLIKECIGADVFLIRNS